MQFPTNMALAAFDPLETSYLSAISLKEYFSEREVGNFRAGQSIREQSRSLLSGHTIWDVFEYRVFQMITHITKDIRVSKLLSDAIAELTAEVVDGCEGHNFNLTRSICRSILLEALSDASADEYDRSILKIRLQFAIFCTNILKIWEDIVARMNILTVQSDLQGGHLNQYKIGLSDHGIYDLFPKRWSELRPS